MRRWKRITSIGIALVGLTALIVYYQFAPSHYGRQNTREVSIPAAFLFGDSRLTAPVVLSTEKELEELLRVTKKASLESGIYYSGHDESGIDNFERSLQDFDFTKECLIIIPVSYGDNEVGMSPPRLSWRKLTCEVWVQDKGGVLERWVFGVRKKDIGRSCCYGLAVKREAVDEVEVWVRGKQAASFTLD